MTDPGTPGKGEVRVDDSVPAERPARRSPPTARWRLLAALAWLAVLAAAGMTVLARLWPDDLTGDTPTLITVHYFAFMSATFLFHAGLGMAAVVVFGILARRRTLASIAAGLALVAAGPETLESLRARLAPGRTPASEAASLTLMSANLLYGRTDPQRLMARVREHRPDVIVFQEWTPRSAEAIKPGLLADYPHWFEATRDDAFGQAVCSRRAFTQPPRTFPSTGGWREPQITVTVDLGGREVRITNVHILPPVDMPHFREQRNMAKGLLALIHPSDNSTFNGPHTDILAGDFNAVSRSVVLSRLRGTGMIEAHGSAPTRGRLRGSTWPRTGMLRHTPGIRIDHILHAPWLRCVETVVCEDVGSDHAPIVARLVRTDEPNAVTPGATSIPAAAAIPPGR